MTNTAYKDLGFVKKESESIAEKLNILLSNYQIHYQKLRNFHWNVKGPDFFDIHEQFEVEYNDVKLNIDVIAERIRTFGFTPYSTYKKYLEVSEIKEAKTTLSSDEMVKEILDDYTKLMSFITDGIHCATENGDVGTSDILIKDLKRVEKRHWMFNSFLNNK